MNKFFYFQNKCRLIPYIIYKQKFWTSFQEQQIEPSKEQIKFITVPITLKLLLRSNVYILF